MPRTRTTTPKGTPSEGPPVIDLRTETGGAGTVGTSQPKPLTEEQLAETAGPPSVVETGPSLAPPVDGNGTVTQAGVTAVTATWRAGVSVTALWSINEIRNAWAYLSGVGWKKLYNGRDGAFSALVDLASQARQTGRTITAREEADGMIYEIYLW